MNLSGEAEGRSSCPAFDAARLHQTVIVPHQQVALDLLQGVQQDAHHDQQRGATKELVRTPLHAENEREGGKDGHQPQEDGTRQVIASSSSMWMEVRLPGFTPGMKPHCASCRRPAASGSP